MISKEAEGRLPYSSESSEDEVIEVCPRPPRLRRGLCCAQTPAHASDVLEEVEEGELENAPAPRRLRRGDARAEALVRDSRTTISDLRLR
jgi:hypothetical protein